MEKYTLDEGISALDRIKLLMSYKESMTLKENIQVIKEQSNEAVRSASTGGLERLKSILLGLGLTPKMTQLPTNLIRGASKIESLMVNTNKGKFYFFSWKPGGYFTSNNFVARLVQNENTMEWTLGSWDLDRIYLKNDGVIDDFKDSGFDNVININTLGESSENSSSNQKNKLIEFIKKTYPQWNVSSNDISINGNIYTIKQGDNEWDFKLVGNTFTLQQ